MLSTIRNVRYEFQKQRMILIDIQQFISWSVAVRIAEFLSVLLITSREESRGWNERGSSHCEYRHHGKISGTDQLPRPQNMGRCGWFDSILPRAQDRVVRGGLNEPNLLQHGSRITYQRLQLPHNSSGPSRQKASKRTSECPSRLF